MREVERPYTRPNACAAKPHIGQTAEGERWVDTTAEISGFDNHVYLCETSIREAAATLKLTFVDDDDFAAVVDELDAVTAERDELAAKNAELEHFKASVYVAIGKPDPDKPEPGDKS